jgi:hypothetical protein
MNVSDRVLVKCSKKEEGQIWPPGVTPAWWPSTFTTFTTFTLDRKRKEVLCSTTIPRRGWHKEAE